MLGGMILAVNHATGADSTRGFLADQSLKLSMNA
jgi:hypothetical protein